MCLVAFGRNSRNIFFSFLLYCSSIQSLELSQLNKNETLHLKTYRIYLHKGYIAKSWDQNLAETIYINREAVHISNLYIIFEYATGVMQNALRSVKRVVNPWIFWAKWQVMNHVTNIYIFRSSKNLHRSNKIGAVNVSSPRSSQWSLKKASWHKAPFGRRKETVGISLIQNLLTICHFLIQNAWLKY